MKIELNVQIKPDSNIFLKTLSNLVENNNALIVYSLKFASNILQSYFGLFNKENAIVEEDFMSDFNKIQEQEKKKEENKPSQESYTPIEILGFSPRTLNALINGGIGSVELLEKCTESKLTNLRGFGKKALTEVSDALAEKNKSLSQE